MGMNTAIPVDHFNAELRKLGRDLSGDVTMKPEWQSQEFGLRLTWPDGFNAWVSFGAAGTAAVEAHDAINRAARR